MLLILFGGVLLLVVTGWYWNIEIFVDYVYVIPEQLYY